MLNRIIDCLNACKSDSLLYLIEKLSDISGFFMTNGCLLYIVKNIELNHSQSISTEYLNLNTDIAIESIQNDQQFKSGRYNVIEFIKGKDGYNFTELESFVNLCTAHTNSLNAKDLVSFFYSLITIFQFPKEQNYKNLIGLLGELTFIKLFYEQFNRDISKLWHKNGSHDKYDFALSKCNLEIKSTISEERKSLIKHSQLFNEDNNYLVSVFFQENPSGFTLNELCHELFEAEKYCNNYDFMINVEKEKRKVSPIDANNKRFKLLDVKLFNAKDIKYFEKIPVCISNVTYDLSLVNEKETLLKDWFVKEWDDQNDS